MRALKLIKDGRPCDTDYHDKTIQTIADRKARGSVICPNYMECKEAKVSCYRRVAQMLAGYIVDRKESFHNAVENEKQGFLQEATEGKFWVFRDNVWQIVEGKSNVIDEIMEFAKLIIDFKSNDRRPFTGDGKDLPEIDMDSVMKNAALDQKDISNELK